MLFRQHRIARLEKALAADFQDVSAIMSDLLDEVRLASQNRKLLVAVNSMNRLNPKSLDDEGMQWFGHDEAAARYLNIAQFFQAGARQNKDALACLNQLPYCFWIAMIAMMVRHQQY